MPFAERAAELEALDLVVSDIDRNRHVIAELLGKVLGDSFNGSLEVCILGLQIRLGLVEGQLERQTLGARI
jgi:hypothetical protein